MLKNILKLNGVQGLDYNAQKRIHGGITKQCVDVIASGCDLVPFSVCQANGGLYNSVCRCCLY